MLVTADPRDKAEVYAELGLRVTYDHYRRVIGVTAGPRTTARVGGPLLPFNTPALRRTECAAVRAAGPQWPPHRHSVTPSRDWQSMVPDLRPGGRRPMTRNVRGMAVGGRIGEADAPSVSMSAESQRGGPSSLLVGAGLSALAWLVSCFVCAVGWGAAKSTSVLSVSSWERWDSVNYLKIAAHGLQLQGCTPVQRQAFHVTQCGTVGWLPGYPWLMRGLHTFGLSYGLAGVVISWVAFYIAIYLVWIQWGRSLYSGRALILLLTFSLFPGCVYNFAVFPLSVTLLFCTGAIVAAIRERFVLMGVLLLAAGLCYPTAWFLTVGLMLGVALVAWGDRREMIKRVVLASFGLVSILVLAFFEPSGHPVAYFSFQDTANPIGVPGTDFVRYAVTGTQIVEQAVSAGYAVMLALQAWIAIVLTGLATWLTMRGRGRRVPASLYPALAGLAAVVGLIVVTSSGAWYRSIVVAAPVVVVLRKLDIRWQPLILAVVGVSAGIVSYGFFTGSLV